jgi:hypothetical protein
MKYWSHDSNVEYRIASNRSPRARRGGNVSSGGDGVRTKDNGNWGRQQRGRDWGCDCGGARTRTRTKTKSSQELAPSGYRANDAQTLKGYLALGSGSNADSSQGVLRPSLRPSLQNLASYITVPPSRSRLRGCIHMAVR